MGVIGVRCSARRTNLWFHLEAQLLTEPPAPNVSFRTDGGDTRLHELLGTSPPWSALTDVGYRIARQVLAIPGVIALTVRPTYFDLDVADETRWEDILPKVIAVIREETDDPAAIVEPRINLVTPVPQWHLALLAQFS